uniref:Uncharacterized protein n=1 Tax=Panagrolaimus sp. JU765 TaxID=591449 RepID=A0AC34R9E4_9BILA
MDLPYFPPQLELRCEYSLSLLAEKTKNHPLSFLNIIEEVPLADLQQFLMTANLEIGAEIRFRFEIGLKEFKGFLTFIGNGLFEFEVHRLSRYLILEQQMNSQNKKVLKLLADFYSADDKIPFTVTSNSNTVVCSGKFTTRFREKTVSKNVAECVKVLFPRHHNSIRYSPKLLDDWFPRTEDYDPFERVKTINKTLGTYISVIKPEMLQEKFILDQYSLHPTTLPVQIDPEWCTQERKRYYI